MVRIEVAKIQKPKIKAKSSNLLAALCFYYPQYTLQEARKLPYKHVQLLLDEMNRIKANDYFNLLQISAAPHTERGKGVKDLSKHYQEIMNG